MKDKNSRKFTNRKVYKTKENGWNVLERNRKRKKKKKKKEGKKERER